MTNNLMPRIYFNHLGFWNSFEIRTLKFWIYPSISLLPQEEKYSGHPLLLICAPSFRECH